MLTALRKNRKSLVGFFLVAVCSLLMLGFGLGSFGSGGRQDVAATVGEKEISYVQINRLQQSMENRLRQQMGEAFDRFAGAFNVKQQALDALINQEVMTSFLTSNGFSASSSQVKNEIGASPYFSQSGLSQESLKSFLRQTGLSAQAFEAEMKTNIQNNQLNKLFKDFALVSAIEMKNVFNSSKTEKSFEFVELKSEDFKDKVDTSDEEALKMFYEENLALFQEPAKARFSYVSFLPKDFESAVEITDEDLELAYKEQKQEGRYRVPSSVKLRQIVLNKSKEETNNLEQLIEGSSESKDEAVSELSPNEVIKAKLEAALDRLDKGESFASIAKEISEDENTKLKGGSLGWSLVKNIKPELSAAVNELDIGEYSEVIELDDSYSVILVEDYKEESTKPFEQVKTEVEQAIRSSLASEYAYAEAEQVFDEFRSTSKSLESFAKEKGLTVRVFEKLLSSGEFNNPKLPGIVEKITDYGPDARELIEVGELPVIFETLDFEDSGTPEFDKVKEVVKAAYVEREKTELARVAAENLLSDAKKLFESGDKTALQTASSKAGYSIGQTNKGLRESGSESIFQAIDARNALFSLDENAPLLTNILEAGNNFYVASLKDTSILKDADFESEKESLQTAETNFASSRLFRSLQESLKKNVELWVDPNFQTQ